MKKYSLLSLWMLVCVTAFTQKDIHFSSSISNDSILIGNYFELSYTLENAEMVAFNAPNFEDFEVVAGPNTSSTMSIVNGDVTQTISYSYYLRPTEMGSYNIPIASVKTEKGTLESEVIRIQVVPNPDGIIEEPTQSKQEFFFDTSPFDSPFFRSPFEEQPAPKRQAAPKKKKRKITKV